MKVVVAAFNQEKALEGAFSVIIHDRRLIVYSTRIYSGMQPLSHLSVLPAPDSPLITMHWFSCRVASRV